MKCAAGALAALTAGFLLAAAPASQPVLDTTIASGLIHLAAPPVDEWTAVNPDPAASAILFQNQKHDGVIQIEVLPSNADVDPDVAGTMAGAIIKELRRQHAAKHSVVIMDPKVERDRRFAILIHEKYKVEDHTCDERYAYKAVGPRVLLMTVYSLSDDAAAVTSIHQAGEAAVDSAKFDRKAFQKKR